MKFLLAIIYALSRVIIPFLDNGLASQPVDKPTGCSFPWQSSAPIF
jgi:hypothetical protein